MPPSSSLWSLFSNWFFLFELFEKMRASLSWSPLSKSAAKLRVWRENDAFIVGGEWGAKMTIFRSADSQICDFRRVECWVRRFEKLQRLNEAILPHFWDFRRVECWVRRVEHSCDAVPTWILILTLFPFELHFDVFIRVVALEVFFPMAQRPPHLNIPRQRYGPITEVSPW